MKRFLACAALLLAANLAHAQGVGINTTGAAADTSAILDLASTAKGFLPPRMTAIQRAAIVLPATGLLVYQTDGTAGLYYNTGTPAAPNWKQVGDAGGGATSQWTTNGSSIHYSAGNVGIQRSTPLARLDVLGGNWDVVGGEGDVRIGDANTRLKIGLATGGGGTGAATIMEHGPAGAYNVLSLGTQGNKVLHVNGNTQRVGIGTDAPSAPLGFAQALGKKITLFPGISNDYGLGIAPSRMQIFSDGTAGGDVAIGTDAAGVFTERFAVKNNGALAVNGDAGAAGQVLQSNGGGAAATWVGPSSARYSLLTQTRSSTQYSATGAQVEILTHTFTSPGPAKVKMDLTVQLATSACSGCVPTQAMISFWINGSLVHFGIETVTNGTAAVYSMCYVFNVGSGSQTLTVKGIGSPVEPPIYLGGTGAGIVVVTDVVPF